MQQLKLMIVLTAAALSAAACSSSGGTPLTEAEAATARSLYAAQGCATCHGDKGQGGIGPNLQAGQVATHPIERLSEQITNGGNGMLAYKDKLKPEEINLLARFIKKEFQGQ
jgi:cytochrome c551